MLLVTENLFDYLILENMQQAKALLKRNNIEETNPEFLELKSMLGLTPEAQKAKVKQAPGYLGKFTKWFFEDRQTMTAIKELYELIKANPSIKFQIDNPKSYGHEGKGDRRPELEALYDFITEKNVEQKSGAIIKALPSRTRKFANKKLMNLIADNTKFHKEIKDFYGKKGGRYKNSNDLYNDTEAFVSNFHTKFNLDTYLQMLNNAGKEGEDYNIIYKSPELLIVQPMNYETSCRIGSKQWCISTSKGQWDNYVDEFSNQYFIYDFTKKLSDKRSYIGVTAVPSESDESPVFSDMHFKDDSRASKEYLENLLSIAQ